MRMIVRLAISFLIASAMSVAAYGFTMNITGDRVVAGLIAFFFFCCAAIFYAVRVFAPFPTPEGNSQERLEDGDGGWEIPSSNYVKRYGEAGPSEYESMKHGR